MIKDSSNLIKYSDKGLYCEIANIWIDPHKPVKKALITHAHMDHFKFGCDEYICTYETSKILKERITKRGNINEQYLTLDYLERLNDEYSRFFLDYKSAPLLIINAADINLESNDEDYESLITMIMSNPKGTNFVNPQPSLI